MQPPIARNSSTREPVIKDADPDRVVVGRIVGSWGLRGDVKIEILSDNSHRFSPGSLMQLQNKPVRVEGVKSDKKGRLRVKLDVAHDRNSADLLVGQELTISQGELTPLPEGSFYYYQIIGMDVWTHENEYLGRVKEILAAPGNDVYVVGQDGAKDVLVPSLANVVLSVDVPDNRMTVQLPPGL